MLTGPDKLVPAFAELAGPLGLQRTKGSHDCTQAHLGRYGVWTFGPPKADQAAEIEKLGYGAVWIGGSPAGDLIRRAAAGRHREHQVATGIINVWTAPAEQVAEAYHRIEDKYPGRFLLGIGIGHPEHTEEYRKPYDVLVEYLDALDTKKVPTSRRVIAALGPKVLKLSARRSAATPLPHHPAAHRRGAKHGGTDGVSRSRDKVVLARDAEASRNIGRKTVDFYLNLSNYLNNWKRLGFTDEDVAKPGSDR